MNIILKFILTNIKEKKFRTFLILLSITLSTALFFSSLSVGDSFKNAFVETFKSIYGKTDVVISPKDTKAISVKEKDVPHAKDEEERMGYIYTNGAYKHGEDMTMFSLIGADMDKLDRLSSFSLYKQGDYKPFTGQKIIISKAYAQKNKLHTGDNLPMFIKGKIHNFKIVGLANPSSIFAAEAQSQSKMAFLPEKTIKEITGFKNEYSVILLKLNSGVDAKKFVKEYQKEHKDLSVALTVDTDAISSQMSAVTIPFLMITILVLITSVFIIYTSFKVITLERLPVLGTFRSIGATQKKIRSVLIRESLIYGIIGGVLAIPIGIGILKLMLATIVNAIADGMRIDLYFSSNSIIYSILLAVIVSVISAYIPIRRSSKLPLKDVIFGVSEAKKSKVGIIKIILGIIMLVIALVAPNMVNVEDLTSVAGLCLFIMVIGMILIIPLVAKILTFIFEKIYSLFGNEASLGIKNIRGNKNVNQNITLLSIIISTVVLVFILTSITQSTMSKMYNNINCNCYTVADNLNDNFVAKLKKLDGIKNIKGSYRYSGPEDENGNSTGIEVRGKKTNLNEIEGIDKASTKLFNLKLKGGYDPKKALDKMQKRRYILVNGAVLKRYSAKVGDYLTLKTPAGYKKYKILAETLMFPREGAISDYYIKKDFKRTKFWIVYMDAKNPDATVKQIKALYGGDYNMTRSVADERKQADAMLGAMFGIMKGFAYILLFIGFFGIINNLLINFIQRRRALAMYKSVGMSKGQTAKMFLAEASAVGIFGGAIAVLISYMETSYIGKILSISVGSGNADHKEVILLLIAGFVAAVVITLLGYIVPLFKGSKLQIIEAIKYE